MNLFNKYSLSVFCAQSTILGNIRDTDTIYSEYSINNYEVKYDKTVMRHWKERDTVLEGKWEREYHQSFF